MSGSSDFRVLQLTVGGYTTFGELVLMKCSSMCLCSLSTMSYGCVKGQETTVLNLNDHKRICRVLCGGIV